MTGRSTALVPVDIYEAAYRVAHDYVDAGDSTKRGVPALAAKTGVPVGTLYNKLNYNESTHHKLTLADVVLISVITGDARILRAFACTLGQVCFPLPKLQHVCDAALLELIIKIGAEGGDFYREINRGLSGKAFTKAQYQKVLKEGHEFIAAIAEAMARLEGLIDG